MKNKNRVNNIPARLYLDVKFGAGNEKTGKVVNRAGVSTNRNLSDRIGFITFAY